MVANVLFIVALTLYQCSTTRAQIPACESVGGSCEVSCPNGFELPMPTCAGDKMCCRKSVNLPIAIFSERLANDVNRLSICRGRRACRRAGGACLPIENGCSTKVLEGKCKGNFCQCCLKDKCKSKKGKKGCSKKGGECKLKAVGCSDTQTAAPGCKGKRCVCCMGPPPPSREYCENCGQSTIDPTRIVGGQETELGEYPWQVLIVLQNEGGSSQSACGGSLIKKKWVLTAAHCFSGITYDGMILSLGDHETSVFDEAASVTVIYSKEEYQDFVTVHPDYNSPIDNDNDIAVIMLKEDVVFKKHIQPICLAMPEDIVTGSEVVVTGWGFTEYRGDSSEVLLEVALDLISVEDCRTKYQNTPVQFEISDNMICTLTPDKDACTGDSGGPLIYQLPDGRWVQIGIVSFGYQCAFNNAPGVYANVANYIDWITSVTGSDQC